MAYDINNVVIDRVVRGIATAQGDNSKLGISKGDIWFSINQITNPSLSCSSDSTDAVDALNTPIATFYRAKNAEFSAENAMFDMNLLATQAGTVKKIASSTSKIDAPCFETVELTSSTTYTLSHTPTAGTMKVYLLKGDGMTADKIDVSTTAAARTIAISGKTVTVVIGDNAFTAGEQLFFMYKYEADGTTGNGAVEVANSATNFPVGCTFTMEILCCDVCDQTTLIYAYLVFPNAKLSPDFDWNIATDSTHPFSMKAMQELKHSSRTAKVVRKITH